MTTSTATTDYLTMAGSAAHVGKPASTILRAIRAGRLVTTMTQDGRTRLIRLPDLLAWADQAGQGRPRKNEKKN